MKATAALLDPLVGVATNPPGGERSTIICRQGAERRIVGSGWVGCSHQIGRQCSEPIPATLLLLRGPSPTR